MEKRYKGRKKPGFEEDVEMNKRLKFEFRKAVIWFGTFFSMLLIYTVIVSIFEISLFNAAMNEMEKEMLKTLGKWR